MTQPNNIYHPLFSVLIANYNNGRYLQESIDSVLAQTYTNWEIVLVDDGSTDNSFEICEKYKNDSRFHIYYNEENKGCGYTKHRCAELAAGELCGFLDPDDKLSLDALEIMTKTHQEHPLCSLAYSTLYLWDDVSGSTKVLEDVGAMENGDNFLISSKKIVSQFAVFKKSFYEKTIGIDKALSSAVDSDLYMKLEEVGELLFVNEPLYLYRQGNVNSISIGNASMKKKAFHNRIRVSLDAFVRRIKGKHPLFVVNEQKSLHVMRWQLGYYHKNVEQHSMRWLRYAYWYWRGNGCSIKSLNHIRKALVR